MESFFQRAHDVLKFTGFLRTMLLNSWRTGGYVWKDWLYWRCSLPNYTLL